MRDDDEEFGHYVPLLRRIIILVAVITAVPVVLWTITAFVRAYVAPAKIPTFHQLAATASINTPANDAAGESGSTLADRLILERQAMARATTTDARDSAPAPKGPLLADRPDGAPASAAVSNPPAPSSLAASSLASSPSTPSPPATASAPSAPAAASAPSAPTVASTSDPPATTGSTSSGMPAAVVAATPSRAPGAARITDPSMTTTTVSLTAPAASPWPGADGAAPAIRVVGNRQADAADSLPPARPLSGPIPLPRHRPRDLGSLRIADMAPANVPIPRRRPDAAGSTASVDTSSAGPIDFLNNLFGAK